MFNLLYWNEAEGIYNFSNLKCGGFCFCVLSLFQQLWFYFPSVFDFHQAADGIQEQQRQEQAGKKYVWVFVFFGTV